MYVAHSMLHPICSMFCLDEKGLLPQIFMTYHIIKVCTGHSSCRKHRNDIDDLTGPRDQYLFLFLIIPAKKNLCFGE